MYEYQSPSDTERKIRQAVAQYCRKTFPIGKSVDANSAIGFAARLNTQLQDDESGFFAAGDGDTRAQIFKPPYAERIIPYSTCTEKISEIGLQKDLGQALGSFRPYTHQRDAFKAIGPNGTKRHLIVCTGTGSGKTESFLLPILDSIVREREEKGSAYKPGVRALILYPMNALVEDQLNRLREIISRLPEKLRPTFGQYTGLTPQGFVGKPKVADRRAALDAFGGLSQVVGAKTERRVGLLPIVGEYLTRDDWTAGAADILITNYSMLERLLLRPDADPFFTSKTWRFLAIDEAHSYTGSMGTEIAWLIRRLQKRVGSSEMRFLATTATILSPSDAEKNDPALFGKRIAEEFGAKVFPAKAEDFDVELGTPIPFASMCGNFAPCLKSATEITSAKYEYDNETRNLYARTVELKAELDLNQKCREILEKAGFSLAADGNVSIPKEMTAQMAAQLLTDIHPIQDSRVQDLHAEKDYIRVSSCVAQIITAVLSLFGDKTAASDASLSQKPFWSWYEFLHDPLRGVKSAGGNDLSVLQRWTSAALNAGVFGGIQQNLSGAEFAYLYAAAEAAANEMDRLSYEKNGNGPLDRSAMRSCESKLRNCSVSMCDGVLTKLSDYYRGLVQLVEVQESEYKAIVDAWRDLLGGRNEVSDVSTLLYEALCGRPDVQACGAALSEGMRSISPEKNHRGESLEEYLAGHQAFVAGVAPDARRNEIYDLFRLTMLANVPNLGSPKRPVPLLDVRYHQVVRGVFDLAVAFPNGNPSDVVVRRTAEDSLHTPSGDVALFNLAVCRDCGQPYLAGYMQAGDGPRALVRRMSPSFPKFHVFALEQGKDDVAELNHREQEGSDEESATKKLYWINLRTGIVTSGNDPKDGSVRAWWHREAKARSFIEVCPNCGRKQFAGQHESDPFGTITFYQASSSRVKVEILEEFVGTSSPDMDPSVFHRAGNGRKVLAFSDSRNKAARFPATFDGTFRRKLMVEEVRQALAQNLGQGPDARRSALLQAQIADIEDQLLLTDDELGEIGESRPDLEEKLRMKKDLLRPARWTLKRISERLREKLADSQMTDTVKIFKADGRTTFDFLEGTAYRVVEALMERWGRAGLYPSGLVEVRSGVISSGIPKQALLNRVCNQGGTFADDLDQLLQKVFSTIFRNIRVEYSKRDKDNGYDAAWASLCSTEDGYDVGFVPRIAGDKEREFRKSKPVRKAVIDYLNSHGCLTTATEKAPKNPDNDEIAPLMVAILRTFTECGVLSDGDGHGLGQLDLTAIFGDRAINAGHWTNATDGIWLEPGPSAFGYDDRYIRAGFVRIEEHTAQLEKNRARVYQRAFSDGRINVLSCSTTFEMGIDVGALPRVMMMNTPPGTANYRQRAGRAGRRPGTSPFILTYAEENMIGLKTFADPRSMFDGPIVPPRMYLEKRPFMSRHLRAEVLHGFLGWWQDQGHNEDTWDKVRTFFYDDPRNPAAPYPIKALCETWLDSAAAAKCETYCRELCEDNTALPYWSAVKDLAIQLNGLDNNLNASLPFPPRADGSAYRATAYDYQELSGPLVPEVDPASGALVTPTNPMRQHVLGRLTVERTRTNEAVLDNEVISTFGEMNVVPRYAFPVDVMRLKIAGWSAQKNMRDAPTRDSKTALYDYAPGCHVYLDKTTYRVKYFDTDDNGGQQVVYCSTCGLVQPRGDPLKACPQCGNRSVIPLSAVRPSGFVAVELRAGERESAQGERVQIFSRLVRDAKPVGVMNLLVGEPDVKLMDFYNVGYAGSGFENRKFPSAVALYHELITDISVWVIPCVGPQLKYISESDQKDPNATVSRGQRAIQSAALVLRRVLTVDVLEVGDRDLGVVSRQTIQAEGGGLPAEYGPAIVFYDLAQGGGGAVLPITADAPGVSGRIKKALDAAVTLCEAVCAEAGVDEEAGKLIPLSTGEWRNRLLTNATEGFRQQLVSDKCFSNEDFRKADGLDVADALAVIKLMRGDFGPLVHVAPAVPEEAPLDLTDPHWCAYNPGMGIELKSDTRVVMDGSREGLYDPYDDSGTITHYWKD